jgi:hypothetical protein
MVHEWDDTQADRQGRAVGPARLLTAVAAICFVAGAAWGVRAYRSQVNPDGISYLSVAEKYVAGDLSGAVNAFWSPLLSWLIVPFLWAGVPAVLAGRLLGVALGAGLIVVARWIASNLDLRPGARAWLTLALVPLALYLGVSFLTPDLLAGVVTLAFLGHVTGPRFSNGRWSWAVAGALAAFAYLAKAYAGWFCLGFLLASAVLDRWLAPQPRGRRLREAAVGVVAFALVAGPWMAAAALVGKHGWAGLGGPGLYNHARNGPDTLDDPIHTQGFLPPPNPTAVSAWEDPMYLTLPDWSPFQSARHLRFQLFLLARNLLDVVWCIGWYSVFGAAVFAVAALALTGRRQSPVPRPAVLVLAANALYPLGYLPLQVRVRYLCVVGVLLLLFGLFLIDQLDVGRLGRYHRAAALLVLCVSFAISPAQELWSSRGTGRAEFEAAERLADALPAGARVASSGRWHATLAIAYYRRLAYYGVPRPGAAPAEIEAELRRHRIEYFLIWGDAGKYPFAADWPDVSAGRIAGLTVRRVPRACDLCPS